MITNYISVDILYNKFLAALNEMVITGLTIKTLSGKKSHKGLLKISKNLRLNKIPDGGRIIMP